MVNSENPEAQNQRVNEVNCHVSAPKGVEVPHVWEVSLFTSDGFVALTGPLVTFDKDCGEIFGLFPDFPEKFTPQQLEWIRLELPFWWEFMSNRHLVK